MTPADLRRILDECEANEIGKRSLDYRAALIENKMGGLLAELLPALLRLWEAADYVTRNSFGSTGGTLTRDGVWIVERSPTYQNAGVLDALHEAQDALREIPS